MGRILVLLLLASCVSQERVDALYDRDGDGFEAGQVGGADCDDADSSVHPNATEVCGDGRDNDCDDVVDDDGLGADTFYPDLDGDGYAAEAPTTACIQPEDHLADLVAGVDCDDVDDDVHPDADEICADEIDNDCDGAVDDAGLGSGTFYADADGDGYAASTPISACGRPPGHLEDLDSGVDCNDTSQAIHPDAPDAWYDGVDSDCAGDDDWDSDADGHRSASEWDGGTDCDDTRSSINPDEPEVCNNHRDDDCDNSPNTCELVGTFSIPTTADVVITLPEFTDGDVLSVGDATGDGAPDLLVAGYGGSAVIFASPLQDSLSPSDARATVTTSSIALHGATLAGDYDGDGVADLAIAQSERDPPTLYVFFGPLTGSHEVADADWEITSDEERFGWHAECVGDQTGDGKDDLLVSATYAEHLGNLQFDGPDLHLFAGPLTSASDTSEATAEIESEEPLDGAGRSFAPANFDRDTVTDVAIGAGMEDFLPGAVYIVEGPIEADGPLQAHPRLSVETMGDRLGISVATGDVDGDGLDDVLAGAPKTGSWAGAAHLFLAPFVGSGADLEVDASVRGAAADDTVGEHVTLGDHNGDGLADLFISAGNTDTGAPTVYLFQGPIASGTHAPADADAFLTLPSDTDDIEGLATADLNGDGLDDLLLSADGRSFVLFGRGL